MVRKHPFRKYIVLIIILLILGVFIKFNNKEKIEQTSILIINKKEQKSLYYEDNDFQVIELYNTMMLPMDLIFEGIFGENYIKGQNQELRYEAMTISIDFENNTLTIPKVDNINGIDIDNTIVVEIEVVNNIKYIPIYLISNLPNVIVKIDNKAIYQNNDYINSKDAFNNGKTEHHIEIYTDENKKEENYSYEGQKLGALWREEALKRIEKYRKQDVKIIVKNQNGKLINNANIEINMLDNEFKFGTAIRNLAQNIIDSNLFNIVGAENDFKWSTTDNNSYEKAEEIVKYATQANIDVRGHWIWRDAVCSNKLVSLIGNIDTPKEGTMAYVYLQYKDGNINKEQAENLTLQIQEDFENIVFSHIEELIKKFPNVKEWDAVNELIECQYFKYYLYGRNYLTDKNFLDNTEKSRVLFIGNEDYCKFVARCFDKVRELNQTATLVLNDNIIKGSGHTDKNVMIYDMNETNGVLKYTTNIDAIGIQYHVANNYSGSPQSYYNIINDVLEKTKIKKAVITEYDNYLSDKIGKYTEEEKRTKADYLRDSLISAYSNKNVYEFTTWVYNCNHFENEERNAYALLVNEWLNYTDNIKTDGNNETQTRLYNGEYLINVNFNNESQQLNLKVGDDTEKIAEFIFNSTPSKIEMNKLPNKKVYYKQLDSLDLEGGTISVFYDDGTVEEVSLTDENVNVTGFDDTTIGKVTLKVNYMELETNFEIEMKAFPEKRINNLDKIKTFNNEIKENYNNYYNYYNDDLIICYNEIINYIELLNSNITKDDVNDLNNIMNTQFLILNKLVLSINDNDAINDILSKFLNIFDTYKEMYIEYNFEDNIDINKEVKEALNNLIDLYNKSNDADISFIYETINSIKDLYMNQLQTNMAQRNYVNKNIVINFSNILSQLINKRVEQFIEEEKSILTVKYDVEEITNGNVIATLIHGSKTKIINNNNSETKVFYDNGEFDFTVKIQERTFKIKATVNNIDKIKPQIANVENNKLYIESVKPTVSDANLKNVKLYKNSIIQDDYINNTLISGEGYYKLIATDKAGNENFVEFQIVEKYIKEYIIEDKVIKNIEGNITKNELEKKLNLGIQFDIYRNKKKILDNDKIKTGDTLKDANNKEYTLIINGDVNSDGLVNIKDIVRLRKYLLYESGLTNEEIIAADTNLDNNINIKDLIRIRIIILSN